MSLEHFISACRDVQMKDEEAIEKRREEVRRIAQEVRDRLGYRFIPADIDSVADEQDKRMLRSLGIEW